MKDGTFYFANPDDEYKLYSMDSTLQNKAKLSDQANASRRISIQLNGDKLFYLQNTRASSEWPFRYTLHSYDLTSHSETKLLDYNVNSYALHEGWIYFSTLDAASICKAKLDGTDVQVLTESPLASAAIDIQVLNRQLIFGRGEGLYRWDLNASDSQSWDAYPAYPYALVVYQQDVYYINAHTLGLHKITADAFTNDTVIVEEGVLSFTITGNALYYATSEDMIYRMGLNGADRTFIAEGSYPIAAGNCLFYYNTDEEMKEYNLDE